MTALAEARRILKPGGRMLLLGRADSDSIDRFKSQLVVWCRTAGLRLAPSRRIPSKEPRWLLAVATLADGQVAVA